MKIKWPAHIPKIKILLADDHTIFLTGLSRTIREIPFVSHVSKAKNGKETLEIMQHDPHDVVFMDIKMPVMDGIETTKQLRISYPDAKVIALSMFDDFYNISHIIELGAKGYLLKNTTRKEIEEALIEVLSGNIFYSPDAISILKQHIIDEKNEINLAADELLRKPRFREILFLICKECTIKEIADKLCMSEKTIENYRSHLFKLTKSKNMVGLAMFAMKYDILSDQVLRGKFKYQ